MKNLKSTIVNGMLWCSFHKKMEPVAEFGNNRSTKSGKGHYCKLAAREQWKLRMKDRKTTREHDNEWTVYELPCGYIGQTLSLARRMRRHRCDGRVTKGYVILLRAKTLKDAKRLECWFQACSSHYPFPDSPKYLK